MHLGGCAEGRKIAYDCRFFLGDRPCVWHKKEGALCECEHYSPLRARHLMIKLDAMGDVLRTTCLLPVMARAWPEAGVTWITRPESVPLLENNPYVMEVIPYGPDAVLHLLARRFNKVVNLDTGRISSALASVARAEEKIGFLLHEKGYVYASNQAAEEWLRLGISDDLKKANRRTYQEIMCLILDLPAKDVGYVLELTEQERQDGKNHLRGLGVDLERPILGIHTGAGRRWPRKQWGEAKFKELIHCLNRELETECQTVLFGGPPEREMNQRIVREVGGAVFDTGCDNPVRHFAAMIACCHTVLSGDSLAMHIAIATRRRVVILFGPTSHSEIELFGLGEKVFADMDCLGCYRTQCDVSPSCMDLISVQMAKEAVIRQLSLAKRVA
jgi:ADP-heptose:LPS heptosyltransferase